MPPKPSEMAPEVPSQAVERPYRYPSQSTIDLAFRPEEEIGFESIVVEDDEVVEDRSFLASRLRFWR